MKKISKTAVILFHHLSSSSSKANIYSQYQIVKMLYEQNLLHKVYCLSIDKKIDIPREYIFSLQDYKFYRILFSLLKKINTVFQFKSSRNYFEKIFELFVISRLSFQDINVIYTSKPLFPKLMQKAITNKVTSIVKASIAHPLLNYKLVRDEQIKWDIKDKSVYTDISRANKVLQTLHLSDKILVNCRDLNNSFLVNSYSVFNEKIIPYKGMFTKINCNLNLEQRNKAPLRFIHISHGNLIKGIHHLVMAWDKFQALNTSSTSQLHIIGSLDNNLKTLFKQRALKNIRNLFYHKSSESPFELIENPTAFVNSSLSEAGPATIIESLSRGIPVITSKNCGLSDLILEGKNGFTYEYSNHEDLVKTILWFEQNNDQINDLKSSAYNSVQSYTSEFCKLEMEHIFKSLA